jgi:glycosyltransferase involved in cell wall biosynthesis
MLESWEDEMNERLAIIIPYCGEFPHVHYTLQSLVTELKGDVDFEIILVNNTVDKEPNRPEFTVDGSLDKMLNYSNPSWLKRIECKNIQSHWAAKNSAIANTDADFIFFVDAHCLIAPGTLRAMFKLYKSKLDVIKGSLHLPISNFFDNRRKIYKLVYDAEKGLIHYTNIFDHKAAWEPNCSPVGASLVKCASTCGMMVHRRYLEAINRWPMELGPYGGGENWFNFAMARLGFDHMIFPCEPLRHWSIPMIWSRDYMPTYEDWARNIMIATYLIGGGVWLDNLIAGRGHLPKGHPVREASSRIALMHDEIINNEALNARRDWLDTKAVMTIEEWAGQRWHLEGL